MDIIKKVAKANSTSKKDVENEISKAIELALANADEETKAKWKEIPSKAEKPTPDELISYLANIIKQ